MRPTPTHIHSNGYCWEFKNVENDSTNHLPNSRINGSDFFSIESFICSFLFVNIAATCSETTIHFHGSHFSDGEGLTVTQKSIPGEFSHHPSGVYSSSLR